MIKRTFTTEDQLSFAKLSGDCNPLHTDPIIARRLLFGQQIVHGLHALLWSADHYLKDRTQRLELQRIKADFRSAIGVGSTVKCSYRSPTAHQVEIQLETDKKLAAWFQISWRPRQSHQTDTLPQTLQNRPKCRKRTIDETVDARGSIPLYLDKQFAAGLFPNLMRLVPSVQLAALLASTRLVGMECPGRNSIFSELDLTFSADRAGAQNLKYQVAACNRPLALILIDVETPGMKGRLKTFFRPEPQRQAAFAELRREVEAEEFSDQQALIIGGSRGLGEVTAKLVAAGGAEVIITYYHGQRDAQHLVEELVYHGVKAECLHFDALKPSRELLGKAVNRSKPLYLYYFATPFIFGAAKGKFSPQRFATFSEYYVAGFQRTVQTAASLSTRLEKIFYPSSAAIEELPLDMGEYAAAKIAGEILCDFLQKTVPGIIIHKPRLPRVATDQTVSLLPVRNQDSASVLLANLRYLRQMQPVRR
jgi:hypothetical protein